MSEPLPAVPGNLDTLTAEIMILKQQTAVNMVYIGARLIMVKEMVGHGNWGAYLQNMVKFSERTAQMFMRVAREFGANPQAIADLDSTKVYTIMEADPEDRPALLEMAPTVNTRELQEAKRAMQQAKAESDEARRREEEAKREAAETGRRLEKSVKQTAEAEERAVQARAEADRLRANPPKDPASEAKVRQLTEQIAQLQADSQKPERMGRDMEALRRELKELQTKRDEALNLQEQAFTVNRSVSALQDAATRQRGVIEVAVGKSFSEDWLEPTAIHDTLGIMEAIMRDLRRILKDSTPSTIDA